MRGTAWLNRALGVFSIGVIADFLYVVVGWALAGQAASFLFIIGMILLIVHMVRGGPG